MKGNYKMIFTVFINGKREEKEVVFRNVTIGEAFKYLNLIKKENPSLILIKIVNE